MQTLAQTASHYIDLEHLPWVATQFDGIEMKVLYCDAQSGMSTILFRMAPGAVVPLHEHTGVEQTYIISGSLEDAEGAATAGNYVWRPGGSRHMAHAPNGAVFISFFTKPNRFDVETKWYTEIKT
jgi:anti-sigma factor ChrR (cupin superfamily)